MTTLYENGHSFCTANIWMGIMFVLPMAMVFMLMEYMNEGDFANSSGTTVPNFTFSARPAVSN